MFEENFRYFIIRFCNNRSFSNYPNLTKITIQNSLGTVDVSAFEGCKSGVYLSISSDVENQLATAGCTNINLTTKTPEKLGKLYTMFGKKQLECKELVAGDIGAIAKLSVTNYFLTKLYQRRRNQNDLTSNQVGLLDCPCHYCVFLPLEH